MTSRGFTLLEMLIVVGLIALVSTAVGVTAIENYRRTLIRQDATQIASMVRHARLQSLVGACAQNNCVELLPHGVITLGNKVVLFTGTSYQTRIDSEDLVYELFETEHASTTGEIVFAPYTARPSEISSITLSGANGTLWELSVTTTGAINTHYTLAP